MKKRILLTLFLMAFALLAKAGVGTHWTFDSALQYQCNLTGELFIDGTSMKDVDYYEVGVFVGDECRGSYLPESRPPFFGGGYVYNMTIYSDLLSGETMTFRVYNHQTGQELECSHNCTSSFVFQNETVFGNALETFAVNFVADPTIICYDIDATANPTVGGTVTGGGTFKPGRTCNLTATANTGYDFVNWTKESTAVSTNANYSFTVSEDAEYVANFQIKTYAITVTADPTDGGTVTGAGTYDYGATCTLTATPATGYQFVNWTKGGVEVSTNATYSFTATDGVEGAYVANFSMEPYVITATANPTEGGTVAVDGTLVHGTTCTLTATPAEHYVFVNWTLGGEVVSTNAAYSFTVTGDGAYVANFELASYEITATVNPAGAGTVTGAGTITYGQTCTLTATANGGYTFTNWTKGGVEVSTNATYSFTVEEAGAYVANFAPKTYTVTASANPTDGGIVTLSPEATSGSYSYGQQVRLRAIAKLGYNFVNWTKGGVAVSTESTFNITIGDDTEGAYVANFSMVDPLPAVPTETHWTFNENTQYSMIITGVMVLDGASVPNTIAPYLEIGAFVGDVCKGSFLAEYVNIPPLNVDGYFYQMTLHSDVASGEQLVFRVWDHINNVELDVTSLSNTNFVADANLGDLMNPHVLEFETNLTIHYNITATANPADGGTVTGSGSYEEETQCTLVATADSHYDFTNWTLNGQVVSSNPTYAFTATADGSYVANFTPKSYSVTVTTPVHGSVEGAGTYVYNTQCVLVATPDEGYHFVNWTKAGTVVSEELSYGFAVDGDAEFVATFAINTYDIVATPSPDATVAAGGGTVTGAGTYEHFATCTLIAIPANNRWVFENWTENDVVIEGATDTLSFEVTGPRNLVANFAPIYTINATVDADIAVDNVVPGTIEGTGDIIKGRTWTLTETPDAGYTFVNWFEVINEERVFYSNETSISEEAQADRTFVAYYTLNSYDITTTVAPDAVPATATEITVAGTVTGDDTYHHYDTCTLVATPSTGYHFVNWTENDVEVSTSATYAFTVVGGRALVANFEFDTHEITVTVSPAEVPATATEITAAGSIEGTGTYNYYDMCTLTATPSTGYHFVNWTENGTEVATTAIYELMVEGDRALVANFELDTHTITLNVADVTVDVPAAAPAVPGTVTGDGTYNYYATCTLVATPATGYHFVNWTENGTEVSASATYEFMVTEDRALVANFELDTHVITLSVADVTENIPAAAPSVPGTVTGDGTYNYYATCTLVATPATGYHFVNWTVNGTEVSASATYEFMVEGDRALVANFELDSYTIATSIVPAETPDNDPDPAGVVTGSGTYTHYSTCELTATANTGYTFVSWTLNGTVVSTDATYSFMVTGPATYVANFEINTYTITATDNPSGFGTITGAGTYEHFSTCTLTATAGEGHTFFNWSENDVEVSTTATYSFTVTGPRTLVAHFINRYVITVAANPTVGGTVTGAGTYDEGTSVTLTATPATGYHFVNWTLNGNVVSTNATYTFTALAAGDYVANFEINNYAITAVANPTAGGVVTGAGNYDHFSTCTLTATANTGYTFLNWTKNGTVVSTNTTYSFMVESAADFVANFQLNSYAITATLDPTDAGTVTGAGTYNHFETCTLTANPSSSYLFVNWTKNGTVVSTDLSISFEVTGPAAYVAHFIPNTYVITATAVPSYAGTVTGAGTYYYNTTCTLTATPNTGHHFMNWTKNGAVVSTDASISFTVTANEDYVAHFDANVYQVTLFTYPSVGGTVTGGGAYPYGQTCVIEAVANEGYSFVEWKLNDDEVISTTPTYMFNVTENVAFVAYFALNTYEITATANPADGGTVTGAGTYNYGESCTLTAAAAEGYTFVNWTLDGVVVSTSANYTFTVTESNDYVANFSLNSYEITATANPTEGGTVTGAGNYNYGASCTLTATPTTGYNFVNWTKNGTVVSTEASYSFTVTGAGAYVANFEIITFVITATVAPDGAGEVEGAGTYNYGATVTMTATAAEGYRFVNWTEGDEVVSVEETFTFTALSDRQLVAHFQSTVGVGETEWPEVSVYPNPATDKLYIETHRHSSRCEIYTITGALVYMQEDCAEQFVIEVSDFTVGAYIVRIISDSMVQNIRFIKQ